MRSKNHSRKPGKAVAARPLVVLSGGSVSEGFTSEERRFNRGWQPTGAATGKDHDESERVGRAVRAVNNQCWFNARKVIQRLPEYGAASYLEDWAVLDSGLVIEHGWVVKESQVIDPTLPHAVGR